MAILFVEQEAHTHLPQFRQWCFLVKMPNSVERHSWHTATSASETHFFGVASSSEKELEFILSDLFPVI